MDNNILSNLISKNFLFLAIDKGLLYRWRKELKKYEGNSFSGHGTPKMTDLEREVARLRKELRDIKMEREILKKAISIFSVSDGKSTSL